MKKALLCMITLLSLSVTARAADLNVDTVNNLMNQIPDLTWKGLTVYGRVDFGYGYSTTGVPVGSAYWGMNPQVYAAPPGQRHISTLNTIGLSNIGVKINEDLGTAWGSDWNFIGKVQTGFDPLTGELDDMCKSRIQDNGRPASQQTVSGMGTKCGQLINGDRWVGISSPVYGKLTVGYQLSILADIDLKYDPQQFWVFSLLQFLSPGTPAYSYFWDNSVKYAYNTGPLRGQIMFARGSQDTGLFGDSYAGNIGLDWKGFSIDTFYQAERNAMTSSTFGVGACGTSTTPSCSTMDITGINSDVWAVMGQYGYMFGGEEGFSNKLTFFAGFQHSVYSDPSDPLSAGQAVLGGYTIGAINNTAYLYGDKKFNTLWGGAKYETGPWTVAAAYYLMEQEFYKSSPTSEYCDSNTGVNCAGSMNTASMTVDYTFNKHLSIYGGLVWSDLFGGYATGYTTRSEMSFLSGVILGF